METLKTSSFELAVYLQGMGNTEKLALILPGRLDTKDYAHMRSHVDFLSSKGYLALSFDPPGTWESSGNISLYNTHNYLKAIDELIEYFGNRPTVLMGHSRGGSMAMIAGITNPHVTHFIPVMSHYGPSVLDEKTRQAGVRISYRDLPPGTEETQEKRRFELPLSYFEDTTKYEGLDTCTKPKLFFLGTRDDVVIPEDVRESYALAENPKQLVELDSDHDYRYHPAIIDRINSVISTFLESI